MPDVNCDADGFLALAMNPGLLLGTTPWQSRPLYVVSGALLSVPFSAFEPRPLRAAYFGYLTFNLLALALAVALFETLLVRPCGLFLARVLAIPLVANDVVKTLVWSPHLQMLNVLEPVLLAWLVYHVTTRPVLSARRALAYALLTGFAPLFYGSGLLLLPALILSVVRRPARRQAARWRSVALAAAMLSLGLAAVATWVAFLELYTGSFRSHEVDNFRQFVWIADRLRAHGGATVAHDLVVAFGAFGDKAVRIGWFPLLLFLVAYASTVIRPDAFRAALRRGRSVVAGALTSLALNVVFFWTVGYYTERLSFNAVPPFLLLTGVLLGGRAAGMTSAALRTLRIALSCTVVAWAVWDVSKPGPWSFLNTAWRVHADGVRQVDLGLSTVRDK